MKLEVNNTLNSYHIKYKLMGTWSFESFGNDAAGDWIMDLAETPTFSFLQATLQRYDSDGMPPIYPMLEAIAAAEVICILKGDGPDDDEEDRHGSNHNLDPTIKILRQQPLPPGLVALAIEVVIAIEKSEVFREYSEDDEECHDELKHLLTRLNKKGNVRQMSVVK